MSDQNTGKILDFTSWYERKRKVPDAVADCLSGQPEGQQESAQQEQSLEGAVLAA